jgi:dTDP-4-amino-4,6-dideoxygalactose transaminase
MKDQKMNRRKFVGAVSAGGALGAASLASATTEAPALLGGKPVRTEKFPSWPVIDSRDENGISGVLQGKKWNRNSAANQFETEYARLTGAKHCLATSSGTSALFTSLGVLGIGPGDEVIVPPYTFIATVNVVLLRHAVPVFVDTDINTFQIDHTKIEQAITKNTRAILPVHLGGGAFDVDAVLAIGRKHKVPVVEDACQSHLGEWRGRKVGTLGTAGCFSFQASKNLNSGEGGAILSNDGDFIERCYAFHNNSRGRKAGYDSYSLPGTNLRMTEFQAALLLAQMSRLEAQSKVREQNAALLTSILREIRGITPAKQEEGCTRNAYHLYMFRYDAEKFAGLPRRAFLKALAAEGVPASGGYNPLNREPFLKNAFASRGFEAIYGKKRLADLMEKNVQCPQNDRLCTEAVWLTQNVLLSGRRDMEQIGEAIRKIQVHAAKLVRV